ncbi:MAG: aldo/keto reductase [Bacteroidales bacterium]|jgi:predicted aldo/keto reductase-like oxidoreductase|nr:aldo/keto reductase [Bacteroidales bacterium]MCI1785685.1 aldo/keto reductase [Bacteroidales bacterium]
MKDHISRRNFLKITGAGSVALGAAAATSGCLKRAGNNNPLSGNDNTSPGKMEYRNNPGNGDKVSLLGFGCMRWPMTKDKDGKDIVDQDIVNTLVDYAFKHGVNYYDTSPAYLEGQSEKAAGIALGRYPRKSYYLATKLSNFKTWTSEASKRMYRDSMEQLQTDYFDYYLLHAIGMNGFEGFENRYVNNGILDFLLEERKAGRIRNLGFSFHGTKDSFDSFLKLHDIYHWDFVQIELNYLDWEHAKIPRNVNADYLYGELEKRKIPVIVMEPLLGGRLVNVPDNIADKLKGREPEKSIASWAFRFAGSLPDVLTVLSGMTSMEHLQDNINTFSHFKPLSPEESGFLKETADLISEYPVIPCNDCKYCMPCPYGIDIPGIFKHFNKCVNDGFIARTKEQEDYNRLKKAYLVSYDRSIASMRQANHCIGCKQCIEHCPQSIMIPNELHKIDSYIERLKRGTLK